MHQADKTKARAIIYKDGKILMLWRFNQGNEYYVFPGGTIEDNETIEDTLKRETMEEVNLEIVEYSEFLRFTNKVEADGEMHEREEYFYFIPEFKGDIKVGGPEIFRQNQQNIYRPEWIDINEIDKIDYNPKMIFEKIKEQVQKYESKN